MTEAIGVEASEASALPVVPSAGVGAVYGRYFALVPLVGVLLIPLMRLAGVPASLRLFSLLSLLVVTTATDLKERKIRNWATYPAFLWAVAINLVGSLLGALQDPAGRGPWVDLPLRFLGGIGIGECLMGAGIAFTIMFLITCFSGGGAGDVKLATAIGAHVGFDAALRVLAYSYVVGGITVLCYLVLSFGPIQLIRGLSWKAFHLLASRGKGPAFEPLDRPLKAPIPLAGFFAAGTLIELAGVFR